MEDILDWIKTLIDYDHVTYVKGDLAGVCLYRLSQGSQAWYVKIKDQDLEEELRSEVEIYHYLRGRVVVPETKFFTHFGSYSVHCFTDLNGQDKDHLIDQMDPDAYVKLYGQALRQLHDLDGVDCPISRMPSDSVEGYKFKPDQAVMIHGNFSLDNLIKIKDQVAYMHMGLGGRGDRYKDLAMAVDQVKEHFGQDYLDKFFQSYGLYPIEYDKIKYYLC